MTWHIDPCSDISPGPIRDRRGFSLLELLIVLTMAGLVTGLATLSLRGHLQYSVLKRTLTRVQELDRHARKLAISGAAAEVFLELSNDELQVTARKATPPVAAFASQVDRQLRSQRPAANRKYKLPAGTSVSWVAGENQSSESRVRYSANGTSQTYFLRIEQSENTNWLCIFGLSGQVTLLQSEFELEEVLASVR